VPKGYWDNIDNQKAFINKLSERLKTMGLNTSVITPQVIIQNGGSALLRRFKGMTDMMKKLDPTYEGSRRGRKFKTQNFLKGIVQMILGKEALENYKHLDLRYTNTSGMITEFI
jgi:hypothetical protein